jgi:nicotinate-nucleotide pyrophosphorylase
MLLLIPDSVCIRLSGEINRANVSAIEKQLVMVAALGAGTDRSPFSSG